MKKIEDAWENTYREMHSYSQGPLQTDIQTPADLFSQQSFAGALRLRTIIPNIRAYFWIFEFGHFHERVACLCPWRGIVDNFLEKPTWLKTATAPPPAAPLQLSPQTTVSPEQLQALPLPSASINWGGQGNQAAGMSSMAYASSLRFYLFCHPQAGPPSLSTLLEPRSKCWKEGDKNVSCDDGYNPAATLYTHTQTTYTHT